MLSSQAAQPAHLICAVHAFTGILEGQASSGCYCAACYQNFLFVVLTASFLGLVAWLYLFLNRGERGVEAEMLRSSNVLTRVIGTYTICKMNISNNAFISRNGLNSLSKYRRHKSSFSCSKLGFDS